MTCIDWKCLRFLVLSGFILLTACGGGGGGGGSTTTSIGTNVVYPRYAYVADSGDNSVSVYAVDAATGRLHFAGKTAAGAAPQAVAMDPQNRFVYVANSGAGTVSAYTIDATSGALTTVSGSPFSVGTSPSAAEVDPSGKFLYVTAGSSVYAFTINGTSGALTVVAGSPYAAGTNPVALAIDPSGKFVYAADFAGGNIYAFTINSSGGALSSAGNISAGSSPIAIAADPAGSYLYVANNGSGDVSAYSINSTSGALTSLGATIASGNHPRGIAVDRSGKSVYVTDGSDNTVSQFTIGAGGVLSKMTTFTIATGTTPQSVTVDPSNHYVYVANSASDNISAYSVDATSGALTALAPGSFAGYPGTVELVMSQGSVALQPVAKYVYATGNTEAQGFTVNNSTGALTFVGGVPGGTDAVQTSIDPTGRFGYVADTGQHKIYPFSINTATGVPSSMSPVAEANPASVAVDPSGRFLIVADNGTNPGNVYSYSINYATGTISLIGGVAENMPTHVSMDPSGSYAWVSDANGDMYVYAINPTSGALTLAYSQGIYPGNALNDFNVDTSGRFGCVVALSINNSSAENISSSLVLTQKLGIGNYHNPNTCVYDPSSTRFYITNDNTSLNVVQIFSFDSSTGAVNVNDQVPTIGSAPADIAFAPSGKFAYVADNGTAPGLYVFNVDPASGGLTQSGSVVSAGVPVSVTVFGGWQ